jgi:predicted regulator of Ras-like GTPase activity (Roadblock/LC7/MglB family)
MPISHSLSGGDANRIAAMVATTLGLGKRICESIGGGAFTETSVSGNIGQVFVYSLARSLCTRAGARGVLAVLAGPGANVGLIHLEAREAARAIENALG